MKESRKPKSEDKDSADHVAPTMHWDHSVRRFEQAWFSGQRPEIGEYVFGGEGSDIQLLLELVHADLEFRLRDNEAIDVTTYVDRFPQISGNDAVLDLIRTEWRVRAEIGSPMSLEKYHDRFPHLAIPLQNILRSEDLRQSVDDKSSAVGRTIGPYKLLQEIGVGGMGAVYLAEQTVPLRRRVALKVIKPGMDSAGVIARFEAERQALAMMNHPNIARVLDAGTTASERPYFVMEYVKGVPITQYCDERRANVQERLKLFIQVCQAVQHAHQKGIVHRDLKPSNVLVALTDGNEVVKIIDFGLAKALHQPLTERTVFTAVGTFIGTLEYMSPEQAVLNALDIDTRSDVYSLGTLLYELLTGTTPLEGATLRAMAYDAMIREIREFEPAIPSARLKEARAPLDEVSKKRDSETHRLASVLRGELDWITMKALEKDRSRRYPTVDALASDVQRFLANEPVEAGPPSASYRLRKLASKYRTAAAAACGIVLLLAGSSVASALLAVRATEDKNRAESDLKELRATNAENLADKAEDDVYRFMEILTDAITSPELIESESRQAWLQDVAKRLARFGGRPLEARVYHALGELTRRQGHNDTARRMFEHALAVEVSRNDRLPIRISLAATLPSENRKQQAIDVYASLVDEAREIHGDKHWRVAIVQTMLAGAILEFRGVGRALPVAREIVDNPGAWTSECQPHVRYLLSRLVRESIRSGAPMPKELPVLLVNAELATRRSTTSPSELAAIEYERALAELWTIQPGKSDKATEAGEKALERLQVLSANRRQLLDVNSNVAIRDRQNLAAAYYRLGKLENAAREYEEVIRIVEHQDYRGSISLQSLRQQLLLIYRRQNNPLNMEKLCRGAIHDQLATSLATVNDLDFIADLGGVQFKKRQYADAEATFRCAISLLQWRFPNSHQEIAKFKGYLERIEQAKYDKDSPK